jgi:translation elongation factor EF-Tu-like GTPase
MSRLIVIGGGANK